MAVHQDAVGVGEEDELIRAHSLGHGAGRVVGVAVQGAAVLAAAHWRNNGQEAAVQQGPQEPGVHLRDGPHQTQCLVLLPGGDEAPVPAGHAAGLCADAVQGGDDGLVHAGGEGHLRRLQYGVVGHAVAVLKHGGHVHPLQQGGDLFPAAVD